MYFAVGESGASIVAGIAEEKTAPPLGEVRFKTPEGIKSWIDDIYLALLSK
jgi:hypothetical protein